MWHPFLLPLALSFATSCIALSQIRLEPWYWLKPGKLDPVGGCDDFKPKLQEAYEEAITMARGASGMIDQLSKALPDKAADYDGHMKWNKAATSLKDLFDISVDANTAPQQRPEVKAAFTKLKQVYDKITEHAEETTSPPSGSRMKLFCGDKFAAYIPNGQQAPDGRTPPRPQNGKSNWWVDPGDPSANVAAFIQVKRPKNPSKPQEGWCGSGQPTANPEEDDDYTLNAATQISQNYIYFCANGMNFPRTQAGQQVTVDHNDPTKSTSLTEMKSLSRTMFHEFNHLHNRIHDLKRPRFLNGQIYKVNGRCVEDANGKVYGYTYAYALARCWGFNASGAQITDKYTALDTVDTYILFAMSMYWEKYQFTGPDGRAEEIPPKP